MRAQALARPLQGQTRRQQGSLEAVWGGRDWLYTGGRR